MRQRAGRLPYSPAICRLFTGDVALCGRRPAAVVRISPRSWRRSATLRQDKPPFNDVRVRRAMSMAIDRQKQVDTLYEGHAILGWGIPYFYFQDERPTAADLGPYWQYRPEEAKKLLAEAGHPNGFKTTLFYYEYFPQMTSQIQLVQQDLKRNLNIELTISKNDYTTYFGRYAEGKWEGTAWGFQTGYAVSLDERTYQYMHSKSPKNYFRIADPVIDELATKLRQTQSAGNSICRRSSPGSTTRSCGCGCPMTPASRSGSPTCGTSVSWTCVGILVTGARPWRA
jgi:ABC-type transport system substrate-binding protein